MQQIIPSEHPLDGISREGITCTLVLDHLKGLLPVITGGARHHLYAGEHTKVTTSFSLSSGLGDEKLAAAQVDKLELLWKPRLSLGRRVQIFPYRGRYGLSSIVHGREVHGTQVVGA